MLREEGILDTFEPPLEHRAASGGGSALLRMVEFTDAERERAIETMEGKFLEIVTSSGIEPGMPEFFDAAEILDGVFPEPVRAALSALRRGSVDAIVLRGLPADADPGPTPGSDDRTTPPPRAYAWLAIAVRRLGHEFAYAREKEGALVHNIHPIAESAKTQSNASYLVDLSMHTENAFHPVRPDFICLYCVRSPANGPATSVVPLDDVLAHLTDDELAVLREPRFTIRVVDSHRAGGEANLALPVSVLSGSPRRPTVRWHESLRAADEEAADAVYAFGEAAKQASRRVQLRPGDLLAFSNNRCLHGRDKFDTSLDGQDRWLLRSYVLQDLSRTLSHVAPARPQVMRMNLLSASKDAPGAAPEVASSPAAEPVATEGSSEVVKPRVCDLAEHLGRQVVVNGWLDGVRSGKGVRFLTIRDRTGVVQAVHEGEEDELEEATLESAVRVSGTVREAASERFGPVEIELGDLTVVSLAQTPLPLAGGGEQARLDHRYLDLRARERLLVFEVQTTLEAAMRDYMIERDFIEIHSPKISAGGSESGAAVFELPYFDDTVCLAQSPQFYMQLAMAAGFDRAFEVGPVFRAESRVTKRHATEFTCIDVEMSWIDSHQELMDFEDALLRHVLGAVREAHGPDIERHCGVSVEVPSEPIPRVPVTSVPELVPGSARSGGRLTHQEEQALSKYVHETHGHGFVFLTGYPSAERPWYTMHEEGSAATQDAVSKSFDLIWRGFEVTSGCQREHRYDRLSRQIADAGLESGSMTRYLDDYYLEMFRHGCPPHGGFGIGLNRLLMAMLGQPSISETSFVYRGPRRFVP